MRIPGLIGRMSLRRLQKLVRIKERQESVGYLEQEKDKLMRKVKRLNRDISASSARP